MTWQPAETDPRIVLVQGTAGAPMEIDARVDRDAQIEFGMNCHDCHYVCAYLGEDERRKLIELLQTTLPEAK